MIKTETKKTRKTNKADTIELNDRERLQFNKTYGTYYSYGRYMAIKREGKLDELIIYLIRRKKEKEIIEAYNEYIKTHPTKKVKFETFKKNYIKTMNDSPESFDK